MSKEGLENTSNLERFNAANFSRGLLLSEGELYREHQARGVGSRVGCAGQAGLNFQPDAHLSFQSGRWPPSTPRLHIPSHHPSSAEGLGILRVLPSWIYSS